MSFPTADNLNSEVLRLVIKHVFASLRSFPLNHPGRETVRDTIVVLCVLDLSELTLAHGSGASMYVPLLDTSLSCGTEEHILSLLFHVHIHVLVLGWAPQSWSCASPGLAIQFLLPFHPKLLSRVVLILGIAGGHNLMGLPIILAKVQHGPPPLVYSSLA
jgi:hypothetical protein